MNAPSDSVAQVPAPDASFSATFWGVRGSISVSGPDTVRFGGNTPCLAVNCGPHLLIFDAGTGLRPLGNLLAGGPGPLDFDIFLTHTHYDHVYGLPFFGPLYNPANKIRIWAGHLAPERGIGDVISTMMTDPLFPIGVETFGAKPQFKDFIAGDTLHPRPGLRLRTAGLNHPNRATGYRIEYAGKSICYLTDTEQFADHLDRNILDLIAGADFVIYDAMYSDEEYATKKGWGHSTWHEGLRLVEAAGAKTLVIFHHLPERTDEQLDKLAVEADRMRPGTLVAHEGMVLRP